MKIDVSEIKNIKNASLNIDITDTINGLSDTSNDYDFYKNANFIGKIENSDGVLKLKGRLKIAYKIKCFRCLKDVEDNLDIGIKEVFSKSNKDGYEDIYLFEEDHIEIDDALRDNILLKLPMKKICRDDCKGLCASCGKDLNSEKCDCKRDEIDPRLEDLKKFFK
ncbi:MAG: DUF177 domain-containing protein [Clostridia bacterium]|jgi:uncharacterized protein